MAKTEPLSKVNISGVFAFSKLWYLPRYTSLKIHSSRTVLEFLPSILEDSVFAQMPRIGSWFSGTRVQLLMAMMPTMDNNEKSFFIGQVGYVKFGTIRT